MQQEIEQPEVLAPSDPSQLPQGDALAQISALENHLAVLRQEIVTRSARQVEPLPVDAENKTVADPEDERAELQLREEELTLHHKALDRRKVELDEREEILDRREEALRQRGNELSEQCEQRQLPETEVAQVALTQDAALSENQNVESRNSESEASKENDTDHSEYLANLLKKPRQEQPAAIASDIVKPAVPKTEAPRSSKPGSPVDLAEILRKQGFSLNDDEAPAEESEKPAMRKSRNMAKPMPLVEEKGDSDGDQASGAHEEESIDDYMSKLLARSRGTDAPGAPAPTAGPGKLAGPTPSAKKATQKAAAIAANKAAKAALAPEPPKMIVPGELAPRTHAPEKNININAIRELANLSASSALSSHQQKTTAVNSQAKLLVTSVSFVLGVALLVFWRMPHASPYALYWALASFGVSAIWGVQFAKLFSKQLVERAARFERHVKRNNEAASQAAANATKQASVAEAAEKPTEIS